MFVFRVKVEELTEKSLSLLELGLSESGKMLGAVCPIREMNVVAQSGNRDRALDIYLALDDFIEASQVRRLMGELQGMIGHDMRAAEAVEPRITTELIQI
ncbi:MAG TPA: hypothetical protein VMJ73_10100 [Rhizomicrobium sp.]|nr:hypothetical protein [Rhizomicrobium sp.]